MDNTLIDNNTYINSKYKKLPSPKRNNNLTSPSLSSRTVSAPQSPQSNSARNTDQDSIKSPSRNTNKGLNCFPFLLMI